MKNIIIIAGLAFLVYLAYRIGISFGDPTIPASFIIMGLIGLGMFTSFLLNTLLAMRATRQGKPWGLKYLKLMASN